MQGKNETFKCLPSRHVATDNYVLVLQLAANGRPTQVCAAVQGCAKESSML